MSDTPSSGLCFGIKREHVPWYPVIDPALCTGCNACAEFCRHGVYAGGLDGKTVVARPFSCVIGCHRCDEVCPAGALTLPPKEMLTKLLASRPQCSCGGKC